MKTLALLAISLLALNSQAKPKSDWDAQYVPTKLDMLEMALNAHLRENHIYDKSGYTLGFIQDRREGKIVIQIGITTRVSLGEYDKLERFAKEMVERIALRYSREPIDTAISRTDLDSKEPIATQLPAPN